LETLAKSDNLAGAADLVRQIETEFGPVKAALAAVRAG
jgi:hypothetical protein